MTVCVVEWQIGASKPGDGRAAALPGHEGAGRRGESHLRHELAGDKVAPLGAQRQRASRIAEICQVQHGAQHGGPRARHLARCWPGPLAAMKATGLSAAAISWRPLCLRRWGRC